MKCRALLFPLFPLLALTAACGGMEVSQQEPSSLETVKQRLALFDYAATESTNYATNPVTSANSTVYLNAGEAVMIGTCGITDASFGGDTFLRLFASGGNEVAANDDSCGFVGSRISYTPGVTGPFTIRAGCYASVLCTGTVAISRRRGAPIPFSVSNTNSATINTYNKQFYFNGGEVLRASTCAGNATGASASGDTYLRLYQNNGGLFTQVAFNDTVGTGPCGTAAEILYMVPSAGYYQVRVGCAFNTACSGNLAVYAE